MFRFETAGESHGECLVATLTGLPAGIPISLDAINRELWRRQQGYGRGGRMKIETDQRRNCRRACATPRPSARPSRSSSKTRTGRIGPKRCPVEDIDGAEDKHKPVTRPRPGHADLAGSIKYNFHDARYILERASARETTARVAVGAFAKAFLGEFGITRAEPRHRRRRSPHDPAGGMGGTGRAEPEGRSACWAAWTPRPKSG